MAAGGQVTSAPSITHPADVIRALGQQVDARWRQFGTFLHFEPSLMDIIEKDNNGSTASMLDLVTRWVKGDDGTGDLPRTWQTVVEAVGDLGCRKLAEELVKKYGMKETPADVNLTGEELRDLQTVSEDVLVWVEIGVTGEGKSTLGNFLLGKDVFEVGAIPVSVTENAQVGCSVLDGQRLCIVDTPGFGDTRRITTQNTHAENLSIEAAHMVVELSKTMMMARHGVHAFFVVVSANSRDLYGTIELLKLLDILGNYWEHAILVFTHGNVFDKMSEGKQYEKFEAMLSGSKCPEVWKTLIEKVGKRYVIVELEDWKNDTEYHARKVNEFKRHSSAIVAAHGPYNDTLHSLVQEYIETAKLELRHRFKDAKSPEAQVAALQVAFPKIMTMLHKLIRIRLAGGVDTELLQKMAEEKEKELSDVRGQRDQLYQQFLKEQEEKRRAQEAKEAQRKAEAEELARVAREAEEKTRMELEEYLKKPTFAERVVDVDVSSGNFYRGKWVYTAEAVDVAAGIKAKGKNKRSKSGAKEHAKTNLKAILLERGTIRKD